METPKEAYARIGAWTPIRPSKPEPLNEDLAELWEGEILRILRKEYSHMSISRQAWKVALKKLHEGQSHLDWLISKRALQGQGEGRSLLLNKLLDEIQRSGGCQ